MTKPKIKYGLKELHFAMLTEGEDGAYTWGTPVRIPGAVSISLSPVGETTSVYADDIEFFTAIGNNGYDGTLEVTNLPDEFLTQALGMTLSTTDKVLAENAETQPQPFALLLQFSTDAKNIRHVLYHCKATRPSIESSTRTNSIENKNDTINLTVRPLGNGRVKVRTTQETPEAVYNGWFTKVYTGEEAPTA